jgi:preprotein translocase subunit SecB
MSETSFPPAGAPQGQQPQALPPLMVNVQYIKDLSFEVPGAPEIYATLRSQPAVQINLDVQARSLQEGQNVYEVVLSVKAEAREAVQNGSGEGRPVFMAELHYAGVFTLTNVPPEAVEPLLLIECPRLLFPFARTVLSDVTREGGFPPVLLQPIDFVGLWQARKAQEAATPIANA